MLTYQMNIREQALQDFAKRRSRLFASLETPSDGAGATRHQAARQCFPAVRTPSLYSNGMRGKLHCFKAGGLIEHESALERDFYRLMEWDYGVDTFVAQPFKVPYKLKSGRNSHYTPDCFVISSDDVRGESGFYAPTAYEIKERSELDEKWPEIKHKLKAARSFLSESGFRFRLLTEDRIHPVFLKNIEFLLEFRGPRFLFRSLLTNEIVERLFTVAESAKGDFTPRYLLERTSDLAAQEEIIPWLWNLYTDYVFQCDLLVPLSLDTVSWLCGHAGRGMTNVGFPSKRPDWRHPDNDWRR